MIEKNQKLILIGDAPFAEVACEYFTYDSPYEVVGFAVEKEYITKSNLLRRPVVPFEEIETIYSPEEHTAFIAIAYNSLNRIRTRLYKETKEKGYSITSYIHSGVGRWPSIEVGENCFIFENNTLQPFVTIGNNVVLWSGNHIGHHTKIDDNVFISSQVVISGCCHIEKNCFFGVNATIADNVCVKRDCLIGAGALILKDTEEDRIYKGNGSEPSKTSSKRLFKVKS